MDVNSSSARDYQSSGLENFRSFSLNTEVSSKKVRDDSIDASRISSMRDRIALISGCPFQHGYSDFGHAEPSCCLQESFFDFACVFRTYPEWKKKRINNPSSVAADTSLYVCFLGAIFSSDTAISAI